MHNNHSTTDPAAEALLHRLVVLRLQDHYMVCYTGPDNNQYYKMVKNIFQERKTVHVDVYILQ